MNRRFNYRLISILLVWGSMIFMNLSLADTQKLIIESGDSAQSRQRAEMERDQWKDTRSGIRKMQRLMIVTIVR